MRLYYSVNEEYEDKYRERLYKLPVRLNIPCPNRDGVRGDGGCLFCTGNTGSAPGSIKDQLLQNMRLMGEKYGAKLFMAYFQDCCTTYMRSDALYDTLMQAALGNILEIGVFTRPDCISRDTAAAIRTAADHSGLKITMELGLLSANRVALESLHRGYGLAEFIDACLILHEKGIPVTAHVIADLPWDAPEDVAVCAKVISALRVEGVQVHALYVPPDTELERLYLAGELSLRTEDEYAARAVTFLCYLNPNIAIHRLAGRIPETDGDADPNELPGDVLERIESTMRKKALYQGCRFDYMNGGALRKKGF